MRTKKTILCIDSNEQTLSVRKFMLETRGYNVTTCINCRDALSSIQNTNIDLVLCDLSMPEVDGAEIIKRIKTISPQIPAILYSNKVKIYEKEMHADLFLPKGMFGPTELLERIRLLLVRKRGPKKVSATVIVKTSAAS